MVTNNLKVYSILLELRDTMFLSTQVAPSLEEAFSQARLEFQTTNPIFALNESLNGIKIGLFLVKTGDELIEEHKTFRARRIAYDEDQKDRLVKLFKKEKLTPPPQIFPKLEPLEKMNNGKIDLKEMEATIKKEKNLLMKEIIKNKDMELLEKNKSVLSSAEIKYIEGQIKGDVK